MIYINFTHRQTNMNYLSRFFGYGEPDASTPPPPIPDPELIPGWEVYKNQRGEILYGNNLMNACQFNAPLAKAQIPMTQSHAASVVQARPVHNPFLTSSDEWKDKYEKSLVKRVMENPYFIKGGLKRKQSRRNQSRRNQSRRKQSRCKQSRRRS